MNHLHEDSNHAFLPFSVFEYRCLAFLQVLAGMTGKQQG
jgi:hypothetical protein